MSNCSEVGCRSNAQCIELLCVCDEGYFVAQDFVLEEDNRECGGNTSVMLVFYSFQLIAALLSLFAYLIRVKRKSQAKRLIPYFIGVSSFILMSILKLSDIDGRFYGKDVLITILFALIFPVCMLASHIILVKYVKLMYKMLKFQADKAEANLKRHESVLYVCSGLSFIASGVFISTLATDDELATELLFRLAFAIMIVTSLVFSFSHYRFGCEISELLTEPAKTEPKIRTLKLRAELVRTSSAVGQFIFMLFYIVGATSHEGLEIYTYLAPVQGTIICLVTILVVQGNRASHSKAKAQTHAPVTATHTHMYDDESTERVEASNITQLKP